IVETTHPKSNGNDWQCAGIGAVGALNSLDVVTPLVQCSGVLGVSKNNPALSPLLVHYGLCVARFQKGNACDSHGSCGSWLCCAYLSRSSRSEPRMLLPDHSRGSPVHPGSWSGSSGAMWSCRHSRPLPFRG